MGDYLRPHRLEEALTRLARPHTVLAGGTDFYPARVGRAIDEDVLDIGGIAVLRGITADRDGLAAGRHHDLERADRSRSAAAVRWPEAGRARGRRPPDPERRHARRQPLQRLAGGRRRALPAGARRRGRDRGPGRHAPPAARASSSPACAAPRWRRASWWSPSMCRGRAHDARSAFLKLGARRYLVISIAMAAATLEIADGRVAAARIAVGACSPVAERLPALEAALVGAPLDRALPTGSRPRSSRRSRRSTMCAAAPPIGSDAVVTAAAPPAGGLRAMKVAFTLNGQAGGLERSAGHAAGRGAARRSRAHRHQGRLRCRRLRRLHRAARRPAGLRLPGRDGPGRGSRGRDGRGPGRRRWHAGGTAEIVSRPWRRPMRHLHARHADGGRGTAAPDVARPSRARGRGCAGRRALPLHRLRQDRRCRDGGGDVGAGCGAARRRGRRRAPAAGRRRAQGHGPRPVRRRCRAGRCALDPRRALAACPGALRAGRPGAAAPAPGRRADGGRRAVQRLRHLSRHQGPAGAGRRPGALSRRGGGGAGRRPRRRCWPSATRRCRSPGRPSRRSSASTPRPRPMRRWCRPTSRKNLLLDGGVRRGNAGEAFAACAAVAEGVFETAFVEHAYIEPEAGWARAGRRPHRNPCLDPDALHGPRRDRERHAAPARGRAHRADRLRRRLRRQARPLGPAAGGAGGLEARPAGRLRLHAAREHGGHAPSAILRASPPSSAAMPRASCWPAT